MRWPELFSRVPFIHLGGWDHDLYAGTLKGISRYGFPGGGSSAPGPYFRRLPDENMPLISGLLGPVRLIEMKVDLTKLLPGVNMLAPAKYAAWDD